MRSFTCSIKGMASLAVLRWYNLICFLHLSDNGTIACDWNVVTDVYYIDYKCSNRYILYRL
jgi:hypothetical protein